MPILSIQKNSFQEPSSRNDPFSSMFQLAQAPLLRGDPIFGVRGAVFGVRAVKGAGGAVLGVTGERASSRWWWKHGRNDPWEVWKKACNAKVTGFGNLLKPLKLLKKITDTGKVEISLFYSNRMELKS